MATLRVRRLGYALGAEVTGVDITKPIDAAVQAEIRQAWLEDIVLCFPGYDLDGDGLKAFAGHFGKLDDNRQAKRNRKPGDNDVSVLTTKPVTINGKATGGYKPGLFWHTDNACTPRPATGTFLSAKELPSVGGGTMFANMYMAYDALSPAMKGILDELYGVHDVTMAEVFRRLSPELQAEEFAANPLVVHPIVRTHPETGRKALYLGGRVRHFVGMTAEESAPLLDYLNAHAIRYEFCYRHRWTLNDVVLWDNRCALHRALADYADGEQRYMIRCALLGPKIGMPYNAETALSGAAV